MKEPKTSVVRSCRFPLTLIRALEQEASRMDRSVNSLIVRACYAALKTKSQSLDRPGPGKRNRKLSKPSSASEIVGGVELRGSLYWSPDKVIVDRAVISSDGQALYLEFIGDGAKCTMQLSRTAPESNEFEGVYTVDNKRKRWSARCKIFESDGSVALVGEFTEDGDDYEWCGEFVRDTVPPSDNTAS